MFWGSSWWTDNGNSVLSSQFFYSGWLSNGWLLRSQFQVSGFRFQVLLFGVADKQPAAVNLLISPEVYDWLCRLVCRPRVAEALAEADKTHIARESYLVCRFTTSETVLKPIIIYVKKAFAQNIVLFPPRRAGGKRKAG